MAVTGVLLQSLAFETLVPGLWTTAASLLNLAVALINAEINRQAVERSSGPPPIAAD